MEQNVIILSADFWSMTDEATGLIREGVTVFYFPVETLEPVKNSDTSFGCKPLKVTMEKDFITQIAAVGGCPCKAIAHNVIRTKSGQQVIVPESFALSKK